MGELKTLSNRIDREIINRLDGKPTMSRDKLMKLLMKEEIALFVLENM